jgi:hypothetical protein
VNYFAHGIRFVDRPLFLAGTAVPDWLSVIDRSVRLRPRQVGPCVDAGDADVAELAAGVLQHLEDDRWFHRTRAFFEVTGTVAALFRAHVTADDRFRASFLGHIVTELLLDRVLHEQHPAHLDRYYRALADVDPRSLVDMLRRMTGTELTRLGGFVSLFLRERFLYDYAEPARLRRRLNQVMHRVRLPELPVAAITVFEAGVDVVRERLRELLPPAEFSWPTTCTPPA